MRTHPAPAARFVICCLLLLTSAAAAGTLPSPASAIGAALAGPPSRPRPMPRASPAPCSRLPA